MDKIFSGIVTKVSNDSFHIEWKVQWGRIDEFSDKVQPEDKRCPSDHFRVDMEIESISTMRVEQALRKLTAVRGDEEQDVTVLTPIQAMMTLNCFMAADIQRINDAEADRLLQIRHFVPPDGRPERKRALKHGASDAPGAPDAHGASDANTSPRMHGATDASAFELLGASDADTQECWVRPCMYVEPPSEEDFNSASHRAGLNEVQRHAMTITGKHR